MNLFFNSLLSEVFEAVSFPRILGFEQESPQETVFSLLMVSSIFAMASYHAFETTSKILNSKSFSEGKSFSSYSTDIVPAKRFTGAFKTPSTLETAFSTRAEQAPQDIPFTSKDFFFTLHHLKLGKFKSERFYYSSLTGKE